LKRYVNAGVYFGPKKRVLHMLRWCADKNCPDDQGLLAKYMNAFPQFVAMDLKSRVVNIPMRSFEKQALRVDPESGKIRDETGHSPPFVHFANMNKESMDIYNGSVARRGLEQIVMNDQASANKMKSIFVEYGWLMAAIFFAVIAVIIVIVFVVRVAILAKKNGNNNGNNNGSKTNNDNSGRKINVHHHANNK
jgi:hypothetical protein